MEPCTQSPGSLSGCGPEERSKRVVHRLGGHEIPILALHAIRAAGGEAAGGNRFESAVWRGVRSCQRRPAAAERISCQDLRTGRNLVPWLCMRSEQLVGMPPAENLFLTARLRALTRSDRLPRSRSLPGDQRTFRPVRSAHLCSRFRAR